MKMRLLLKSFAGCFTIVLGAGCGGSLPAAPEPNQARTLLVSALDAWKGGKPVAAMASASPSIRVLDREWGDGVVLSDYELQGSPHPVGVGVQQSVTLNLKPLKGKPVKKTINYTVTTGDVPVIARQDIDE